MATDRHWSVSRPASGTGVERLSAAGGQVGDQRSAALRGGGRRGAETRSSDWCLGAKCNLNGKRGVLATWIG